MVEAPLVVLSDLHIPAPAHPRGRLLIDFLGRLDPEHVHHLVLLGDVFDFFLGGSSYFEAKFAPIAVALERVHRRGIAITYVQGNHEFFLSRCRWPGVRFVEADSVTIAVAGTDVALAHGDTWLAPWHYSWYLGLVRSALCYQVVRCIPHRWLDRLALSLARRSRQRNRPLDLGCLQRAACDWLVRMGTPAGFFGHFHVGVEHTVAAGGQVVGLESWYRPNALGFDGKAFRRHYLERGAGGETEASVSSTAPASSR